MLILFITNHCLKLPQLFTAVFFNLLVRNRDFSKKTMANKKKVQKNLQQGHPSQKSLPIEEITKRSSDGCPQLGVS